MGNIFRLSSLWHYDLLINCIFLFVEPPFPKGFSRSGNCRKFVQANRRPHNWKLFIKASGGKLQWTSLARSATYNFLEFFDMTQTHKHGHTYTCSLYNILFAFRWCTMDIFIDRKYADGLFFREECHGALIRLLCLTTLMNQGWMFRAPDMWYFGSNRIPRRALFITKHLKLLRIIWSKES